MNKELMYHFCKFLQDQSQCIYCLGRVYTVEFPNLYDVSEGRFHPTWKLFVYVECDTCGKILLKHKEVVIHDK